MRRMIKSSVCLCVMILLGIKPIASVPCIVPSSRCLAINGSETICVSFFIGTGLDWFQAKSQCEADGGRLAHVGNYSAESGLITTSHARHVRVGVMTSVRGDDMTFMTNTSDLKCTNTISQQCSSTTSPSECAALGCCFNGCICQYPENQFVTSVDWNFTRLPSPNVTERSCVQLNSNHTWSPFNCSEPGGIETVYACERKCSENWPIETYQNVTWIAPVTASLLTPKCTTPLASQSASGITSTGLLSREPDGGTTGESSNTAPRASTRPSPYIDGVATAGDTSAKIQHTTAPRVIETSTDGSQSVACQFNVQVLWLMILMAMSTVLSEITFVNSSV